jgi:hypothetical protein
VHVKAVGKGELTSYTKSFVASADGTRIGYRQLGSGPGVVLLHGGVNASQHLMRLGSALAEMFTIGIPGRRGRGVSGPIGSDYSLRAEDEDLAALLEQTGASRGCPEVRGDDVPLQDLRPTIHHEIELVKKTEGSLDDYRGVPADVLLLYGRKTDSMFKVTAKTLPSVLPHCICIELPDLDHRSVQNYGKPKRIAPLLQVFFHPAGSRSSHATF